MDIIKTDISIEKGFNYTKNNGKLYYSYPKIKNLNRTHILYLKDCINIRNNINFKNIDNLDNSGDIYIYSDSNSENQIYKGNDTKNKENLFLLLWYFQKI